MIRWRCISQSGIHSSTSLKGFNPRNVPPTRGLGETQNPTPNASPGPAGRERYCLDLFFAGRLFVRCAQHAIGFVIVISDLLISRRRSQALLPAYPRFLEKRWKTITMDPRAPKRITNVLYPRREVH